MGYIDQSADYRRSVAKLFEILNSEKQRLYSIYGFAIFGGLVQLSLPLGLQTIISLVQGGVVSTSIILLIAFVVVGVFLNGLFQVKQLELVETIKQRVFTSYAFEFADKLLRINLDKYNDYYLPETVNRFFDTQTLQKGLAAVLKDIPPASIQILFGLILLSFYHPVFIVFGFLLFLVLFLIIRLTSKQGMATSIAASDYKYMVAGWLEELARTIRSFKFSQNEAMHLNKTNSFVKGFIDTRTAHFRILKMQYWSLIGFKLIITLTMLVVGVILLTSQQLNIGQFVAAEIVILMVITSVEKFIVDLDKVYDVLTAIEKLGKVTFGEDEKDGVAELANNGKGVEIKLEDVSYTYNNSVKALSNINVHVKPGEILVLTGSSGSGKSTLLRLLSGSYKNFSGNILIDNIAIQNYQLNSLRRFTGALLHHQEIFHGSIRENITMGIDIPQQQVNHVADILGLSAYIANSPYGLETILHPGGQHLPNSITKKILLMRALTAPRKLLLLEEPTEYLDQPSANALLDYITTELIGCTIVITTRQEHLIINRPTVTLKITNGNQQ